MTKKETARNFVIILVCSALILCAAIGVKPIGKAIYPREYSKYVEYYAAKYQLEDNMVYAFIHTESKFKTDANSGNADARGLMQITEQTFYWIKSIIAPSEDVTFDDMYDAEQSIRFGCFMLAYCMQQYNNDISTTAAAYHNGITLVKTLVADDAYSSDGKTLDVFPYRQMNLYVRRITTAYNMYNKLYN